MVLAFRPQIALKLKFNHNRTRKAREYQQMVLAFRPAISFFQYLMRKIKIEPEKQENINKWF